MEAREISFEGDSVNAVASKPSTRRRDTRVFKFVTRRAIAGAVVGGLVGILIGLVAVMVTGQGENGTALATGIIGGFVALSLSAGSTGFTYQYKSPSPGNSRPRMWVAGW